MATDAPAFKIAPPRPPHAHPAIAQDAVQFYAVARLEQRAAALGAELATRT